uniref:Uncharacterized protein n=1 Tax=Calcidiscus leptoporus TaxID=127549 RepID=A0A7S0IVB0_9EUKA
MQCSQVPYHDCAILHFGETWQREFRDRSEKNLQKAWDILSPREGDSCRANRSERGHLDAGEFKPDHREATTDAAENRHGDLGEPVRSVHFNLVVHFFEKRQAQNSTQLVVRLLDNDLPCHQLAELERSQLFIRDA